MPACGRTENSPCVNGVSCLASWTLGCLGTCLVIIGGIGTLGFIHDRFGKVAKQITSKQMVQGVAFSVGLIATGLLFRKGGNALDPYKDPSHSSSPKRELEMWGHFKYSGMSAVEFIEAVKNASKLMMLDVRGFLESLKEEEKQERIQELIQAIAVAPSLNSLNLSREEDKAAFVNMQAVKEALPDEHSKEYKKYIKLIRPYLEASWFEGKTSGEIAVEVLERCCEESHLSIHPNFAPQLDQIIKKIEADSKLLPDLRTDKLAPPPSQKPSIKGRRALEIGAMANGILLMAAAFYLDKQKRSKGVVVASVLGANVLLVGGVFSWLTSLPKSTPLERLVQYLPAIDPDDAAKVETLRVSNLYLNLRIAGTWKKKTGAQYLEDLLLMIRSCPNLKCVHLDDNVFSRAKGVPKEDVVKKVVHALDHSSATSVILSGWWRETSVFLDPMEMQRILNDALLFKRYSKLLNVFEASWHEETPPLELALQMFKGLKNGEIYVRQQRKMLPQEQRVAFGVKVNTWLAGDEVSFTGEERTVAMEMVQLLQNQLQAGKRGESVTLKLKPKKDLTPQLLQAIQGLKE